MALFLCLICLGCTQHPDGWKKAKSLDKYITNYEEVETILCEQFNTTTVSIRQNGDIITDVDTLEQFGNGTYFFTFNDINCSVKCVDHIAQFVYIDSIGVIYTPTVRPAGNMTEYAEPTQYQVVETCPTWYDESLTYSGPDYMQNKTITVIADNGTYALTDELLYVELSHLQVVE